MKFLKFKKNGFSMMEVALAVLIVSIIAMLTIPIVTRQMEKTDEYSYYLAYKTVEKMSGQIVALGDPEEINNTAYKFDVEDDSFTKYIAREFNKKLDGVKTYFVSLGQKLADSETYLFKRLFPKTFAASTSINISQTTMKWTSEDFDYLWLAYRVCGCSSADCKVPFKTETLTATPATNEETGEKYCSDSSYSLEDGTCKKKVTIYWSKDQFDDCYGYTLSSPDGGADAHENLKSAFSKKLDSSNEVTNFPASLSASIYSTVSSKLKSTAAVAEGDNSYISNTYDAKHFCNNVFKLANGSSTWTRSGHTYKVSYVEDADSGEDDDSPDEVKEGEEGDNVDMSQFAGAIPPPTSKIQGECIVTDSYTITYDEGSSASGATSRPSYGADWCTNHGYRNMTNAGAPHSIDCQCSGTNIETLNNEKACYAACPDGQGLYDASGTRKCCSTDFNVSAGACCPEHSVYNGGETCECIAGYEMEAGVCVHKTCPQGSTMSEDGVCVQNPPIIKAKRLCELVAEHWNVIDGDTYCDAFETENNVGVYKDVYNKLLGNDANNTYMSIDSQVGAFKNLKPNIVFSNGLKMWILGDKAASIPGLSFFPADQKVSMTQNMCRKLTLASQTEAACSAQSGWFCNVDKNCFTMDSDSLAALREARNCCGSTDFSDIKMAAMVTGNEADYEKDPTVYAVSGFTVLVDINGDKGDGTLWDDVYPFFIGANGTVYPGYPLNAVKDADSASSSLYSGGNSEKQLPVDVYYYESVGDNRKKVVAFPGVSFARGMCSARKLREYTPYCLNLGGKFSAKYTKDDGTTDTLPADYLTTNKEKNPCYKNVCYVAVKRKLKLF